MDYCQVKMRSLQRCSNQEEKLLLNGSLTSYVENKEGPSEVEEISASSDTQEQRSESMQQLHRHNIAEYTQTVLSLILLERLQTIIDPQLLDSQCGFRKGKGTVDQIWVTQQLVDQANEYQTLMSLGFVDLTKAYDSMGRSTVAIQSHTQASRYRY